MLFVTTDDPNVRSWKIVRAELDVSCFSDRRKTALLGFLFSPPSIIIYIIIIVIRFDRRVQKIKRTILLLLHENFRQRHYRIIITRWTRYYNTVNCRKRDERRILVTRNVHDSKILHIFRPNETRAVDGALSPRSSQGCVRRSVKIIPFSSFRRHIMITMWIRQRTAIDRINNNENYY